MLKILSSYFKTEGNELLEWAKCGESYLSVTPTVLWAVGAAALTQRLLTSLFRRFIFRRVPIWERILQKLLFIWMVIYSVHFWVILVKIIKVFVEYCYEETSLLGFQYQNLTTTEDLESQQLVQQLVIWACAVVPLVVYYRTRPRPPSPQLMIWITTGPWLRREMGPNGYYLNRPYSTHPSTNTVSERQQALRRAFSDSSLLIKEPPKRKRHSKSV